MMKSRDNVKISRKTLEFSLFTMIFEKDGRSGVESAISQGLYRQAYCGCIYSEQERYDKIIESEKEE